MAPSRILSDDDLRDPYEPLSLPTMRASGVGSPDEPTLGRIDQYDLRRKLGGGGFGVVYLALDTTSGIEVALKTLHPLLKSNAEEMDVLRGKFALVSRLSHPNIATALVLHPCQRVDIWDETARRELHLSPGDSVMVMRYAPGVTLSRWRRQFPGGTVPFDLAIEVARQVASALDYAHGERIVHRDIKPGNIMVETLGSLTGLQDVQDASGTASVVPESPVNPENPGHPVSKLRVRLLDFGLAAEIRSSMSRVSTETGDTSGTRPYMAPEQWMGRRQDGRTDQYALACVLYELLSGAPPFAGVFETGDPAIMANAVVNTAPEDIEDLPAPVNVALRKALAKDLKDRFASCGEFVEECLAQRPRSPQSDSHTETQRYGDGGVSSPSEPPAGSTTEYTEGRAWVPGEPPRRRIWPWIAAVTVVAAGAYFMSIGSLRNPGNLGSRDSIVSGSLGELAPPASATSAEIEEIRRKAEEDRRLAENVRPAAEETRWRLEQEREATRKAETARSKIALYWGEELKAGEREVIRVGSQEIALRWCPATTSDEWKRYSRGKDYFVMGRFTSEKNDGDDDSDNRIMTTNGFWIGETEVTQGLWKELMGETVVDLARKWIQDDTKYYQNGVMQTIREYRGIARNADPSIFCGDVSDNLPVYNVCYDDAIRFCRKLTDRLHASGIITEEYEVRLPEEWQWEFACKAGTDTDIPGIKSMVVLGKNNAPALDNIAWYSGNSSVDFSGVGWDTEHWEEKQYPGGFAAPRQVGTKAANEWGIHDMIGNLSKWCDGTFMFTPDHSAMTNAPSQIPLHVSRGGSWASSVEMCSSSFMSLTYAGFCSAENGFRLAVLPVKSSEEGEDINAIRRELEALVPELMEVEAKKYAFALVDKADDEQLEAKYCQDRGDLAGAVGHLQEAIRISKEAIASARQAKTDEERREKKKADKYEAKDAMGKQRPLDAPTAGSRNVIRIGSEEIALRWCPPGTFTMGSPASEDGRNSDETQHSVTLSKGFWMGETEVTQGQWREVMGSNPSSFKSGDNYPVETVSWNDCQEFLAALNRKSPMSGFRWTLPTEAQWEYACRAGSMTAYFWGNALNGDKANCDGNYPCGTTAMGAYSQGIYRQKTAPVRRYQPNAWGLYDMHGNVWEWCSDWYGTYPTGDIRDPKGPSTGSHRVFRGGSWINGARFCRSACRARRDTGFLYNCLGFRVALVPVQ